MLLQTEALLNDFATRSFRDQADSDYIAARLSHRARLIPQFLWSAQQTLEKYLKAILLFNRIPAAKVGHDLGKALLLIDSKAPFSFDLSLETRRFLDFIDSSGRFRYFEVPYSVRGWELFSLDKAVWEIRLYCKVLDYEIKMANGKAVKALPLEIDNITRAKSQPFHKFKLMFGQLEKILKDRSHPARAGLVYQNMYFGERKRDHITFTRHSSSSNSPLYLHPEILDEVLNYVYLPKDLAGEYRALLASKLKAGKPPMQPKP